MQGVRRPLHRKEQVAMLHGLRKIISFVIKMVKHPRRYRIARYRLNLIARQWLPFFDNSPVDGELLGIVAGSSAPVDPATIFPVFTLRKLAAFELEATFRKQGMSALECDCGF